MLIKSAGSLYVAFSGKHREVSVVITGCYAQLKPKEIATIPGLT